MEIELRIFLLYIHDIVSDAFDELLDEEEFDEIFEGDEEEE